MSVGNSAVHLRAAKPAGPEQNWHVASAGNNPYQYRKGWSKAANYAVERFQIPADASNYQYGSSPIVFNVDKRCIQKGRSRLRWVRGGIVDPAGNVFSSANAVYGGSGNYTDSVSDYCFPDYEAFCTIDSIRWIYGQRVFEEKFSNYASEHYYKKTQQEDDLTQRRVQAIQSNGQLSIDQRKALAATTTGVENILDLKVPWADPQRHLVLTALPNKIRVEVTFKALPFVLQNPNGNAVRPSIQIIGTPVLEIEGVQYPDADADAIKQMTMIAPGIVTKHTTQELHLREPVPGAQSAVGQSVIRLQLKNFRNSQYQMTGWVRSQRSVDGSASGVYMDPWAYLTPVSYWLEDNGQRITEVYQVNPDQLYDRANRQHPNGQIGLPWMVIAWCPDQLVEQSDRNCHGSQPMYNYNNPTLCFVMNNSDLYDTPNSVPLPAYLDVVADVHNTMIQYNGDVHKYFIS